MQLREGGVYQTVSEKSVRNCKELYREGKDFRLTASYVCN